MNNLYFFDTPHKYYVCATGTPFKSATRSSRKECEALMNDYCYKHNIQVECTECDKHERKYSNHNGVRFYINRI